MKMPIMMKHLGCSMNSRIDGRLRGQFQKLANAQGAQIVEFAFSLPLLVLVVVGIMDFGSAVMLKHKLDIALEQAARVAANQTMWTSPTRCQNRPSLYVRRLWLAFFP